MASDDEVRPVKASTLVIAGDRDVPSPEHALELSRLFPDGRLLILPGGHGAYLGELVTSQPGAPAPEPVATLIEELLDQMVTRLRGPRGLASAGRHDGRDGAVGVEGHLVDADLAMVAVAARDRPARACWSARAVPTARTARGR